MAVPSVRRTILKTIPAALAARALGFQAAGHYSAAQDGSQIPGGGDPGEVRLPNGKLQRDVILKADYDQNVKDARELIDMAKSFELELEKSDPSVLSLGLLKKLDDMEKVTKRIRGRMRR
jgi:hypothetical protein